MRQPIGLALYFEGGLRQAFVRRSKKGNRCKTLLVGANLAVKVVPYEIMRPLVIRQQSVFPRLAPSHDL